MRMQILIKAVFKCRGVMFKATLLRSMVVELHTDLWKVILLNDGPIKDA